MDQVIYDIIFIILRHDVADKLRGVDYQNSELGRGESNKRVMIG